MLLHSTLDDAYYHILSPLIIRSHPLLVPNSPATKPSQHRVIHPPIAAHQFRPFCKIDETTRAFDLLYKF